MAATQIQTLGHKIFVEQVFTMDEVKEYTRLTNEALGY